MDSSQQPMYDHNTLESLRRQMQSMIDTMQPKRPSMAETSVPPSSHTPFATSSHNLPTTSSTKVPEAAPASLESPVASPSTESFFEKHKKKLMIGGGVLLFLFICAAAYHYYCKYAEEKEKEKRKRALEAQKRSSEQSTAIQDPYRNRPAPQKATFVPKPMAPSGTHQSYSYDDDVTHPQHDDVEEEDPNFTPIA